MASRLVGDSVVPEAVQQRRRSLRNRLQDLRDPIRSRRESIVPGPDVIGRAEQRFTGLRDRFVSREGVVSRIRSMRDGSGDQSSGGGQGSGSGGGSSGSNSSSGGRNRSTIN